MKTLIILTALIGSMFTSFAQTAIDASKTQKIKQGTAELTAYEGKPYTGAVTEGYADGKPKSWKSIKDGITEGLWQEWHPNGKLKYNAYWKDGKGHGLWQYFHENGLLKYEESYLMDIPTGISRAYYENGQLKDDNFFLAGKKHGAWSSFSETGVLLKMELWEDGKVVTPIKN